MTEPITADIIKNMIAKAKEFRIPPLVCNECGKEYYLMIKGKDNACYHTEISSSGGNLKLGDLIKPTQEMKDLLKLCVDWYGYSGNECGGKLHCILDDDNTDDYFLSSHLEECKKEKYENYKLAKKIINRFFLLTQDQRNWVTYNIYDALEGKEREVYEEIGSHNITNIVTNNCMAHTPIDLIVDDNLSLTKREN